MPQGSSGDTEGCGGGASMRVCECASDFRTDLPGVQIKSGREDPSTDSGQAQEMRRGRASRATACRGRIVRTLWKLQEQQDEGKRERGKEGTKELGLPPILHTDS